MLAKIETAPMASRIQQLAPRSLLRRIAPVWVVCLIVGSLLPSPAKDAIGTSRLANQPHARMSRNAHVSGKPGEWKHRSFHILGFGATTLLFLCLARNPGEELLSAAGVFGLGVFLEYAQMWLYANELEVDDIRDDGYGIIAMYLLVIGWGVVERIRADRFATHREIS
jgi:hypothetical protein